MASGLLELALAGVALAGLDFVFAVADLPAPFDFGAGLGLP